jgi:predicted DNA-binding transcriptional regulator YafY
MKKKSRILYIKRYLEEHTDEEHPATLTDILRYLDSVGITANRRTVMLDIDQIIDAGSDVVINRSTQNRYFIGGRHLELPEIKLLIDAVQASRFISHKKSEALINKLISYSSRHQAGELARHLYTDKQIKSENEQTYIAVDLLNTAINTERQIHFRYYEYSPEKKKTYKHEGQIYEFSPYGLIWNGDHYYTAGYSKHHSKVITFRVDRIAAPKLTKKSAVPKPDSFDMAFYAHSVFQMYDGPIQRVTLLCLNHHMKTIIDRFGEDTETTVTDTDHFTAAVDVAVSPTFLGWVFANRMRILAPEDVIYRYQSLIDEVPESP